MENEALSEEKKWMELRQQQIKGWIDETLRYIGQAQFDVYVGRMKVVIELSDGSKIWFFYSVSNIGRNDIVGAVVTGLMDRNDE